MIFCSNRHEYITDIALMVLTWSACTKTQHRDATQRKKLPGEGTGGNTGLIDEAVLIHLDHRFVVSGEVEALCTSTRLFQGLPIGCRPHAAKNRLQRLLVQHGEHCNLRILVAKGGR